jgi:hypothetical protein
VIAQPPPLPPHASTTVVPVEELDPRPIKCRLKCIKRACLHHEGAWPTLDDFDCDYGEAGSFRKVCLLPPQQTARRANLFACDRRHPPSPRFVFSGVAAILHREYAGRGSWEKRNANVAGGHLE